MKRRASLCRTIRKKARVAAEVIYRLTDADTCFVSRAVLVEIVWVLERAYGYGHADFQCSG